MTKKDLIAYVAETVGVTKKNATQVMNAVFQGIEETLVNKEECRFVGFGTFRIRKRAARMGRNPRTGEIVKIKEAFTVSFSAGKNLKKCLNLS